MTLGDLLRSRGGPLAAALPFLLLSSCNSVNPRGPVTSAIGATILERTNDPILRAVGYFIGGVGQQQSMADAVQLTTYSTSPYSTRNPNTTDNKPRVTFSMWIDTDKDGHPSPREQYAIDPRGMNLDEAGLLMTYDSPGQGDIGVRIRNSEGRVITNTRATKTDNRLYLHFPAGSPLQVAGSTNKREHSMRPGSYEFEVTERGAQTSGNVTITRNKPGLPTPFK